MVRNNWRYSLSNESDIHVQRGDVLAEYTPLGSIGTWVVESIDDDGLELSRGGRRLEVRHQTIKRSFRHGALIVGAPR